MASELHRLFDRHMRPKSLAAGKLAHTFAHWLVAELRERGVRCEGLGPVHPHWRLAHFPLGKEMLQRELNHEQLFKIIARVYFYSKPRSAAEFDLCWLVAQIAFAYGLVGNKRESA